MNRTGSKLRSHFLEGPEFGGLLSTLVIPIGRIADPPVEQRSRQGTESGSPSDEASALSRSVGLPPVHQESSHQHTRQHAKERSVPSGIALRRFRAESRMDGEVLSPRREGLQMGKEPAKREHDEPVPHARPLSRSWTERHSRSDPLNIQLRNVRRR